MFYFLKLLATHTSHGIVLNSELWDIEYEHLFSHVNNFYPVTQ